jgi:nicotinamide-nucleotide amidase
MEKLSLLLAGVSEEGVLTRAASLRERFSQEKVEVITDNGIVRIELSATGKPAAARSRLLEMEVAFTNLFAGELVSSDGRELPEVVLDQLAEQGATLATAESCTGGLVSAWLTEVPGASAMFRGGAVTYTNEAKEDLVAVPQEMLVEHGAVSEPVARAMAEGTRERFGADWGIGITGIAGPTGGTADKPIGLVHWAVAGPGGTWAERRVFNGDRSSIRRQSANAALDLLRRRLAGSR